MCGIAGITDKRIGKPTETIEEMVRSIAHRGPDDDGFYIDKDVALGMRRLAIIDLEKGKQPIQSADERFTLVFNGEIYNYLKLKRELEKRGQKFKTQSDTEVVLRLFEMEGTESFKRLRGMFAFAIFDREERKVYLARDPFGIKPLYYWSESPRGESPLRGLSQGRVKAFSSEIKSFLKIPGFNRIVNDAAVYNYLSYQYNPLEETFFKSVYKLPPGHFITIDLKSGVFAKKRYFQFKFKPNDVLREGEGKQMIRDVMEDSVAHHMIADVPVGSFLSGGIDSSIIATLMQKIRGEKKIKTFTVGFTSLSEGREARETAEPLGTDHTEITVTPEEYFEALPKAIWHFDEPVADPSALGLYFLAREARKYVKVVLSGEGSDELFGGYNIYLAPIAAKRLSWLPKPLLDFLAQLPLRGRNYATRALLKLEDWYIGNASIFKKDEVDKLWKNEAQKKFSLEEIYNDAKNLSDSAKMQYVDINTWLVGDILAKADKMTMAHSLELRVPFLDVEVARVASMLPDRFKWKNGVTKYLLREAFRSVLPESARTRKKLGFPTPVREWFTAERKWIYELILANTYIKSRFNLAEIETLIREQLEKKADHSRKLYLLLILAIWYNTFIEELA
jgi:asparagine synthase (glutamine-hydrolysing)